MYNKPWAFMLASVMVLLLSGYGITNYGEFADTNLSLAPRSRPGYVDYQLRDRYFESDTRVFLVLITDVAGNEMNVLSKAQFEQIVQLRTDLYAFTHQGKTFSDYCRQIVPGTCQFDETDPLNYWYDMSNSTLTFDAADDADLLATINTGVNKTDSSWTLPPATVFSSNTPSSLSYSDSSSSWNLQKSPATSLKLFLENSGDSVAIDEFEVALYKDLVTKSYAGLEINFIANSVFQDAFGSTIQDDLVMVQIAIALIVLYSFFVIGSFTKYQSRFLLTFGALISILVSLFEAYALASWLGFRVAGLHNLLPFLILGIGFDDVYVLMNGLDHGMRAHPDDVEHQVIYAYEHNAMSITISSLTNMISFSSGYFSAMDAISSFAVFAGFGILLLYFNTLNFFGPLMVWDAQRQAAGRVDCCGVLCCCLPEEKSETQLLAGFYSWYYDSVLSQPLVKAATPLIVLGLICAAVVGLFNVDIYFNTELMLDSNSPAYRSIMVNNEYFQGVGVDVTYYQYGLTDYASLESQAMFGEFKTAFEGSKYYNGSYSLWYDFLVSFVEAGSCDNAGTVSLDSNGYVPATDFIPCVNALLTANPSMNRFITLNDDADAILNATIIVNFEKTTAKRVEVMDNSRRLAKFVPQPTFAFNDDFLDWDMDAVFMGEVQGVLGGNVGCIFVILLLTLGNLYATVIVTCNVVCTVGVVMGSIWYWGLQLNIIVIVHIFMSVGVAVDYSAHIMHDYLSCQGTYDFRAKASLTRMAPAVSHAILSTFLAIIVTAPASTYVFRAFFRLWMGIVVFGTFFAVWVMPILLSLKGPVAKVDNNQEEDIKQEEKQKEKEYELDENESNALNFNKKDDNKIDQKDYHDKNTISITKDRELILTGTNNENTDDNQVSTRNCEELSYE